MIYFHNNVRIFALSLKIYTMIELSKRIIDFVEKYAKLSPNYDECFDERYTGPDVYQLLDCAELLSQHIIPRKCNSDWDSGCYGPYTSKDGKELHDSLVNEINKLIKNK